MVYRISQAERLSFQLESSLVNYGLSLDQVFSGKLDRLINKGLKVFVTCNQGYGRSTPTARALNARNIPTVRLEQGLNELHNHRLLEEILPSLALIINRCPIFAVVMSQPELKHYAPLLSHFQYHSYLHSQEATEGVLNLLSDQLPPSAPAPLSTPAIYRLK